MFIVPITLFSCAQARRRHQRVDDQPGVDDGVDLGRPDDPLRAASAGCETLTNSVRSSSRVGSPAVDADDRLDLLEALERLREAPAPVGGEAGDQDAPGLGVAGERLAARALIPTKPTSCFASISCRFSWIRARISWASGLDQRLVLGRLRAAELDGVDRLEEADLELRRQVAEHPERAEPREGRGDREVDQPGEPPQRRRPGRRSAPPPRRRRRRSGRAAPRPASPPRRSRRGRSAAAGSGPGRASRCPCGPPGRRARAGARRRAGDGRSPGARRRRRSSGSASRSPDSP